MYEVLGEFSGLFQLTLVVRSGTAASLSLGEHHFHAIGLQHGQSRRIHRWIEYPLNAPQNQAYSGPAGSQCRKYAKKIGSKRGRTQAGQELFHGLKFWAKETC